MLAQRLVATLQPGLRGVEHAAGPEPITVRELTLPLGSSAAASHLSDAEIVAMLPADAATVDLAEAPRIVGGGAGLDGAERFEQLADARGGARAPASARPG